MFPLSVQSVMAIEPRLSTPPPVLAAEPSAIVRPEIIAVKAPVSDWLKSTWKTVLFPPPLIVRFPAPGPSMMTVPPVVLSSSRSPWARVIVAGVLRLKLMTAPPGAAFACSTAQRSVPGVGKLAGALSSVLVTVKVPDSKHRSSSMDRIGLSRR